MHHLSARLKHCLSRILKGGPVRGILLSVPLLVVDATRMRVLLATRMRVLLVTRMRVPLVTLMIDVDATLTHDVITIYDSHYYSQIQKLN